VGAEWAGTEWAGTEPRPYGEQNRPSFRKGFAMVEEMTPNSDMEVTADDKLWAALSWVPVSPLFPLVSILVLLVEGKKERPFIRYNAVLSLATGVILIPISIVTFGLGALAYLVFFWWAYQAYQGQVVTVPFVSDFVKNQGWA
jgi:uncharacterized membrane protein